MLGLDGLGDIGNLMRGVQDLQRKMGEIQDRLAQETVGGEAGGGMVKVTVNGRCEVVRVEIDSSLLTQDDQEMLQELIAAAATQGINRAKELGQNEMSRLLGGANVPPGILDLLGTNPGS